MAEGDAGRSADDLEAIRLAKARLMRIFRFDDGSAHRAMLQAAKEQRAALVAVALRVLAASPEDLAAGRVVPVPPGALRPPPRQQRGPRGPRQYGGPPRGGGRPQGKPGGRPKGPGGGPGRPQGPRRKGRGPR
jgi:hypothetical protein